MSKKKASYISDIAHARSMLLMPEITTEEFDMLMDMADDELYFILETLQANVLLDYDRTIQELEYMIETAGR